MRLVVLALVAVTVVGCGGGSKTAPVHGRVSLDGKPLTAGTVTFTPEAGRSATGYIQSDGTFSLTTFAEGDGALPGPHKVSVSGGSVGPPQRPNFDTDDVKGAVSKAVIPVKYANPDASGLTFEVKLGEDNAPEFDLKAGK